MTIHLKDSSATEIAGAKLLSQLPSKCLIFLFGQLGAGKTTFVRGLLRAAGYQGTVKSPTYNLVEEYALQNHNILHFDLYRLKDPEELEWIGMDDYLAMDSICLIEWPEMGNHWLPKPDIEIFFQVVDDARTLSIEAPRFDIKFIL